MPQLITPVQKINCGVCRACCIYLTIPANTDDQEENRKVKTWVSSDEDEKPAGIPCPQLNPNKMKYGCTIHSNSDKPSTCSSYLCAYSLGFLGNDIKHRPDNLGAIIDIHEGTIRLAEIDKGALERKTTKKIMWELEQRAKSSEIKEWSWAIIPFELMGTKKGVQVPITKLSINKKPIDEHSET